MLKRSIPFPAAVLLLSLALIPLMAGCGSADLDRYDQEVSYVIHTTREELAGILGEHKGETSGDEHAVQSHVDTALEEASEIYAEMAWELEDIEVPVGLELTHEQLIGLYSDSARYLEHLATSLEEKEHEEGYEEEAASGYESSVEGEDSHEDQQDHEGSGDGH
ncbi:MAG: hypothetical protein SWK76_11245 [Actinomycetota bacterium]|nr:hypothetical protein [Actinomycetota bacterium]